MALHFCIVLPPGDTLDLVSGTILASDHLTTLMDYSSPDESCRFYRVSMTCSTGSGEMIDPYKIEMRILFHGLSE
jgi:hypothetical protein